VIAKIKRNLDQLGITYTDNGTYVLLDTTLQLTYEDATIQNPMGGIDPATSPYLGIGIANPGFIKLYEPTNASGATPTMPEFMTSVVRAQILAVCAAFANDISLVMDNTSNVATEIVRIRGTVDFTGMGM
jgi:hypothetical protein